MTIACVFWPLMWAMKPRPHASCSFAGSYRPWRAGGMRESTHGTCCHVNLVVVIGVAAVAGSLAGRHGFRETQAKPVNTSLDAALRQAGIRRSDGAGRNTSRQAVGFTEAKHLRWTRFLGFNLNKIG